MKRTDIAATASRANPWGYVIHSHDEYIQGAVRTNTIEGFRSRVEPGVIGTSDKVSRKYRPLYVNQLAFR